MGALFLSARYPHATLHIKRTSEAPRGYMNDIDWSDEEARIRRIESKYPGGSKFRTEEPLKGYREYVLIELIEKARRNGVL